MTTYHRAEARTQEEALKAANDFFALRERGDRLVSCAIDRHLRPTAKEYFTVEIAFSRPVMVIPADELKLVP